MLFTYGYVPEPNTIIANIKRIPSGHHLRIHINDGSVEIFEYWNAINLLGDDKPSVDLLKGIVNEAVLLNVRSDVPVAVALSGGLDSSLVSALAHRTNGDVQAISIGYAEWAAGDESGVARSFAEYLGMPFHRVEISIADASRNFEQVCQRRDEPISDLAGPGYDALAQTARELGFPVLLNGQGGDELFWGYSWVLRLAKHASQLTSGRATNRIESMPMQKGSFVQWLDDFGGLRTNSVLKQFAGGNSSASLIPLYRLQVGHSMLKRQISQVVPGQSIGGVLDFPLIEPSLYWSLFALGMIDTYLKSNGLAQMDRLTMAHSVEGRTPLVDYRLVEYALSTMSNKTVLQQPPKALMKELAARFLPAHVVNRPKRGFTPPVREWIRGIWQTQGDSLKSPLLAEVDAFDQVQLLRTLQSPIQRSGRVNQLSLRLLTLELWLRGM